ncbi:MAG: helix-turn-helix transcriptional regulator [Pseudomonadota bacterium]
MTASAPMQDPRDHFAHCVQVLGGITASARRLGIDERAIRRFINGERPVSSGLMEDTAKALRVLIAEATAAEGHIAARFGA